MKGQAIGLRSDKKLIQFTTKRHDLQFFLERLDSVSLFTPTTIWSPPRTGTSRSGWRRSQTSLSTTNYTFFMNTNPGFAKMNTWMTIGDNETFQMQRLTLVEHRNLDTVSKPCRDNTSFSLTRCCAAEGFMKNEEEKNRKKIDKKLPFAVALRGAFPNQLDASFPGTRQHLVLTLVKTFTSSGTSRWDLTILAHAFSGIFQNDI